MDIMSLTDMIGQCETVVVRNALQDSLLDMTITHFASLCINIPYFIITLNTLLLERKVLTLYTKVNIKDHNRLLMFVCNLT